jgi:hypothetical protein
MGMTDYKMRLVYPYEVRTRLSGDDVLNVHEQLRAIMDYLTDRNLSPAIDWYVKLIPVPAGAKYIEYKFMFKNKDAALMFKLTNG